MIGATEGKEPDAIQDEDLLSLDEMRGAMKDIKAAHLTNIERATVQGCLDELSVIKKMLLDTDEQNNRLINLYQTLRNEFEVFKANHQKTLSLKVNHGSTTPEDYGPDA